MVHDYLTVQRERGLAVRPIDRSSDPAALGPCGLIEG